MKPLDEILPAYWEWAGIRKSPLTVKQEKLCLRGWVKLTGGHWPTIDQIDAFAGSLKAKNRSPATVNAYVISLRNVTKWAVKRGHVADNPAKKWELLPVPVIQRPLWSPEQILHLLKLCQKRGGSRLCDFIGFLALSGARKTETCWLRWEDVDFEKQQVTFPGEHSKFGKRRVVDCSPALLAHLRDMHSRRRSKKWVFTKARDYSKPMATLQVYTQFYKAREEAGLTGIKIHDMRHFFASNCLMSGVDGLTASKWLGHTDTKLVSTRYGHLNNAYLRKMAESVHSVFASPSEVEGCDHTCDCLGVEGPHEVGSDGCIRYLLDEKPRPAGRDKELDCQMWWIDGKEVSEHKLRNQWGLKQHPCGCWSRRI